MSLVPSAIRAAIASVLTARFPALTVEPHGGAFTERELALSLGKAPCLLVACTRFSTARVYESHEQASLGWALYAFGTDAGAGGRDAFAIDLVYDLLRFIPGQRWGLAEADPPDLDSLTADNLYTGQTNLLRVSVWGLAWTQTFRSIPP